MADAVLLLGRHFGQRPHLANRHEDGIVAEAVFAARGCGDHPLQHPLNNAHFAVRPGNRRRAAEARGALRRGDIAHHAQQLGDARGVISVRSCEPARLDAGLALERVNFQARVIGGCDQARRLRCRLRLGRGVLGEGRAGFGSLGNIGEFVGENRDSYLFDEMQDMVCRKSNSSGYIGHRHVANITK